MKVYLPNDSRMSIGGGWRFRENLIKGSKGLFEITDSLNDADISLIAGATMVLPETFTKLKEKTKVILRLDGVPEAWRNDGRTWGRFKHYFEASDGVVCQSEFVKMTTFDWLHKVTKECPRWCVIMNGVDKNIFKKEGDKIDFGKEAIADGTYMGKRKNGVRVVLNINSRKDENKRIEEVITRYRYEKLKEPNLVLVLAGKYPTYLTENQFGLYDYERGKDWFYLGVMDDPEKVADLMRSCDEFWFPSFADPCPNVLIEALHCGCKIMYAPSFGSTEEITNLFEKGYDFGLENMSRRYQHFFMEILNEK